MKCIATLATGASKKRLHNHDQNKEFWNLAVVATSSNNSMTDTHVRYLEWRSIQAALEGQFTNKPMVINYQYPDAKTIEMKLDKKTVTYTKTPHAGGTRYQMENADLLVKDTTWD